MKCEGSIPGKKCENEGFQILHSCPMSEMGVSLGFESEVRVCNCCKSCYEDCLSET